MWGNWAINFVTTLPAGDHTMELYGGEGCCDGVTNWRVNGQDINQDNVR